MGEHTASAQKHSSYWVASHKFSTCLMYPLIFAAEFSCVACLLSPLPTEHLSFQGPLSYICTLLLQSLSLVTQLAIHVSGSASVKYHDHVTDLATTAVNVMISYCGPLSHITVSSEVLSWPTPTYTPLLHILGRACSSLTHLSISMREVHGIDPSLIEASPNLQHGIPYDTVVYTVTFQLDSDACDALRSLTHLQHLDIGHGMVADNLVWAALPSSLQSLRMGGIYQCLPEGFYLPSLCKLALQHCCCHELWQLLRACPKLQQLKLKRLFTPDNLQEQADLLDILSHPVWCLANSGGRGCSPVGEFFQNECACLQEGQPGYLCSWKVLSMLPTMSNVTSFHYNFDENDRDLVEPVAGNPGRLLHYIVTAFPCLKCLHLFNLLLPDSDLTELHACSSLLALEICGSFHVSGRAALLLASALENLVSFEITTCELVTEARLEEIETVIQDHVLAQD